VVVVDIWRQARRASWVGIAVGRMPQGIISRRVEQRRQRIQPVRGEQRRHLGVRVVAGGIGGSQIAPGDRGRSGCPCVGQVVQVTGCGGGGRNGIGSSRNESWISPRLTGGVRARQAAAIRVWFRAGAPPFERWPSLGLPARTPRVPWTCTHYCYGLRAFPPSLERSTAPRFSQRRATQTKTALCRDSPPSPASPGRHVRRRSPASLSPRAGGAHCVAHRLKSSPPSSFLATVMSGRSCFKSTALHSSPPAVPVERGRDNACVLHMAGAASFCDVTPPRRSRGPSGAARNATGRLCSGVRP
jgi:hypothetical protein